MPVEQMQVTITKPIEDAINSVPGSGDRAVHYEPRIGRSQPLLRLECGHVPHAAAGRRSLVARCSRRCPPRRASPPTDLPSRPFPSSATASRRDSVLSQTQLWEIATYDLKPPLNRVDRRQHGHGAGRQSSGVPRRARHGAPAGLRRHHHRSGECAFRHRTSSTPPGSTKRTIS